MDNLVSDNIKEGLLNILIKGLILILPNGTRIIILKIF